MAKWRSQTLSFKSVTDKQKNVERFSLPGGVRCLSPTKLGMVIAEVRSSDAPTKHVRIRNIVSPLRGAENLEYTAHTAKLKPSITPKTLKRIRTNLNT